MNNTGFFKTKSDEKKGYEREKERQELARLRIEEQKAREYLVRVKKEDSYKKKILEAKKERFKRSTVGKVTNGVFNLTSAIASDINVKPKKNYKSAGKKRKGKKKKGKRRGNGESFGLDIGDIGIFDI